MALAPGLPRAANTSFAQMIHEVSEQMTNFGHRLQELSLATNVVRDATIDVSVAGQPRSVVIDGLPYRVSVHDVTVADAVEEGVSVHRIALTDFAGTERSFLCDVMFSEYDVQLFINTPDGEFRHLYTCGTHGDNGQQTKGSVFEVNAPEGQVITQQIYVIGIETADRLAQRFQPPVGNGRHDYDQLVDELYAMQDSLYTIHRLAIRVNRPHDRQQLQQMVCGMRGRLAALENAAINLLDIAELTHDLFERAMVVQEVLPRVPSPPGLPPVVPPLAAALPEVIAMAEAYQMPAAADLSNFKTICSDIVVRLNAIRERIHYLESRLVTIPHNNMFIDLNGPNGTYRVHYDKIKNYHEMDIRVEGNEWRRDLFNRRNQRIYTVVYQPNIQRWLVFIEEAGQLVYDRTAGPYKNGLGGQAMSVRVGHQHRLYFMGRSIGEDMLQNGHTNGNGHTNAVREQRKQLIGLGHHFYRAVEAMNREVRAAPPPAPPPIEHVYDNAEPHWLLGQEFPHLVNAEYRNLADHYSALLNNRRQRYEQLLQRMQRLYERSKMAKEYFDCAVYMRNQ